MDAMQQHLTPAPRRSMIVGISGATGNRWGSQPDAAPPVAARAGGDA
jgi:hypothetical protein